VSELFSHADGVAGSMPHLEHHDVAFVVVSRHH
jgi:predicted dithiol-disulfide oxidoreductase (DUF899 family)